MKALMAKALGGLRPVDDAGEDMLRAMPQGTLVRVEVKRVRNPRMHRLFWALMTVVWQNLDQDRYPTVEDLAAAIKIVAGLRTRIELPNGDVGFIPGSIAFHKMDQTEFSEFYERVCDLIARHFLPGVTSEELKGEVEIMVGLRRAA
jgi:hypothetical protein